MQLTILFVLVLLTLIGFFYGRRRSVATVSGETRNLHSLPRHYGYYVAIWCGLPAFVLFALWNLFEPGIIQASVLTLVSSINEDTSPALIQRVISDVRDLAATGTGTGADDPEMLAAAARYNELSFIGTGALIASMSACLVACFAFASRNVAPGHKARDKVERVIKIALLSSSALAILTTVGIVASLIFEAGRFFTMVAPLDFLFGLQWSPQIALRADQVGAQGSFGAIPIFAGTLLISFIALCVSVPIGLLSAIYMAEYASPKVRGIGKPFLEILAGIPTVVYGFFAALVVAPAIRGFGSDIGLDVSSESALAAGMVMGIMIIPFVSSLSDDVIRAVPQAMRDGSYGLGATKSETIKKVLLPAALPGIVGGFMLAASRAIGETMIVVMAAGLVANLTINPLEAVTTATVQMVTLLVGDQEFDSPKTLAAFALGLVLFAVTLCLNVIALRVVQKYREQYD